MPAKSKKDKNNKTFDTPGLVTNFKGDLKKLRSIISKRKTLFVFVLLVFVLVIAALVYFTPKTNFKDNTSGTGGMSKLEKNTENTKYGEISPFRNIKIDRNNEFEEYAKTLEDPDYWNFWNWEENLIYANIRKIDYDYRQMKVYIAPPTRPLYAQKEILVSVRCSKSKTVAISDEKPDNGVAEVLYRNFDIFEKAQVGDTIVTYCMEEDCINLGDQCILIVGGK